MLTKGYLNGMYMNNISGRKQENINSDRLWGEKCGDRGECDFTVHIMLFQFKSKIILNADSWGYLKPNELESWRMKPINLSFR